MIWLKLLLSLEVMREEWRRLSEQLKMDWIISILSCVSVLRKEFLLSLKKYPGIPTLSTKVVLPSGISESDIQRLIDAIQQEYSEKVMKFAYWKHAFVNWSHE
jgi:hypothetical protein